MEGRDILKMPMGPNDIAAATVGDYLIALLEQLWDAGEGFSGKRPFGNSGWEWDLKYAVSGITEWDDDGEPNGEMADDANERVALAITAIYDATH